MMKKWIGTISCFLLSFLVAASSIPAKESFTERAYVTGYNALHVVDPKEPKVVASIPVTGPVRDLSFSEDGRTALLSANGRTSLYLIDTVENKVIDEWSVTGRTDQGLLDRRIFGAALSPDATKAYIFVTQGEKLINQFKVHPSKIIEIDVKTKKELRSIEAPYGVHALQMTGDDPGSVLVWGYDLYKLKLDSWKLELAQSLKHPKDPKDGSSNVLLLFPRDRESGYNSFPIIKSYPDGRVTEGMGWYHLKSGTFKSVEFDRDPVGMFSAVVDNKAEHGYIIMNHWYKVDLKNGKVLKETMAPTGTIYGINISSDSQKLYLSAGGNDFIVADRDLNVEKIIKLPSDGFDVRVNRIQNQ